MTAAPTTSSPFSLNLIPVTPRAVRPIWRTLPSLNLRHIPFLVTIKSIFSSVSSMLSIFSSLCSSISLSMVSISLISVSTPSSSIKFSGWTPSSPCSTIRAVTSSSFSSRLIARTPIERIFLNSLRFVRFTMPFLVKNASDLFCAKSVVGMIAFIFSSGCNWTKFTTALPFAVRLPSGIL